MGFNPRLAPYTITFNQSNVFEVTDATVDMDWFRFPFAGEVLSAYAAVDTNIETDTATALTTVAIGKSAAGTGAYQAVSSRVVTANAAGSTWDNLVKYTLSNSSSVATMQFAAGDWAMIRRIFIHTTGGSRALSIQMDYVLGHAGGV